MRNSDVMKYLRLLKIGLHTQADIVTALRGTLYSRCYLLFVVCMYHFYYPQINVNIQGVQHRPNLELACNVGSRLYMLTIILSMYINDLTIYMANQHIVKQAGADITGQLQVRAMLYTLYIDINVRVVKMLHTDNKQQITK